MQVFLEVRKKERNIFPQSDHCNEMVTRAQDRDINVLGVRATAKPKTLWRHYSEVVITTCTYVEKIQCGEETCESVVCHIRRWGDSNHLRMLEPPSVEKRNHLVEMSAA